MAFGTRTKEAIVDVAEAADSLWMFGNQPKGFDWITIGTLILGFIQAFCKKPDEAKQKKLVNDTATKLALAGVTDCIECCMPENRAKRLRKKFARKGIKNRKDQDRAFYTFVMAASSDKEACVMAMTSATKNNETDGDEDE